MEYPLPGPVVALLQEEKASIVPKSYFITSGKKSIKITLVYSKGQQSASHSGSSATVQRKKSRQDSSKGKRSTSMGRRASTKSISESSSSLHHERASSSSAPSDLDQACSSPDLPMLKGRARMSTVDSGHPSSAGTLTNEHGDDNNISESASEAEEDTEDNNASVSSSESDKPRTPGRDIAVAASSIGPGETPVANRDEMWQTWTRIPRPRAAHRAPKALAAPSGTSHAGTQSQIPAKHYGAPQRRSRLHDGVSWDGSGNL